MAPIKPAASRKFPRKAGALRCILAKAAPSIARAIIRTRRFGRALQNQRNASVSRSLGRRATRVAAGLVRAIRRQADRRGRGRVERRESSLTHFTPRQWQTAGIAPQALQPGPLAEAVVGGDAAPVSQRGTTVDDQGAVERGTLPPVLPRTALGEELDAGGDAILDHSDAAAAPSNASFDQRDAAFDMRDRELIREQARLYEQYAIDLRKLREKHIASRKETETPSDYYHEHSLEGAAALFESDLPGVYWESSSWKARCTDGTGKKIHLGTYSNIFDAYGARLDFLAELVRKGVNIRRYKRVPYVEANLARLRQEEEDRLTAGRSNTTCSYVDCIRGKHEGGSGFCSSHHGLLCGAMTYDMAVAMSLQAKGHRIIILDGAYRVPGCRNLTHAPDGALAIVYYDSPDENGMIGHQVILCNDGNGHDGNSCYPTQTESDNAHSMIALAGNAKLYAVLLRHEYVDGVRTPLPQVKAMLNSMCHQLGENGRPGRSMYVYNYRNRHSTKTLQRCAGSSVDVKFVKENDESTWNLGVRQIA